MNDDHKAGVGRNELSIILSKYFPEMIMFKPTLKTYDALKCVLRYDVKSFGK
jgi:hypothetical protein